MRPQYLDERPDLDSGAIGRPKSERGLTDSDVLFAIACDAVKLGKTKADFEDEARADDRAAAHLSRQHDEQRALDRAWKHAREVAEPAFEDISEDEPKRRRAFLTAAEIRAMPRPHDFVENLIYERCVSVWAGPAKSGKSYLILDLAHAVALGSPWAGRDVEKGGVLVMPLEGVGLLQDRIRAWELEHKATSPIIFSPTPLNLLKGPKEVAEIVDFVRANSIKLVIIDTLARAMPGANEAAFEDISRALATIDHLKDATGAHVLIVHHFGHSRKGPRGHSDILGNPDLVVEITREGPSGSARVTHNRNGPDGEALRFGLKWRETDIVSSRGKRVFGGVVELSGEWFADLDTQEKQAAALTDSEAAALDIIRERDAILGSITRTEARDLLWRRKWGPDASRRQAVHRLFKRLEEKGAIAFNSDDVLEIVQ